MTALACSHSYEIFSPAGKRTSSSYSKPLNTSVAIKHSAEIYSPSRHLLVEKILPAASTVVAIRK